MADQQLIMQFSTSPAGFALRLVLACGHRLCAAHLLLVVGIGFSVPPAVATDLFSRLDAQGQMHWSTQAWDSSYQKAIALPPDSVQSNPELPMFPVATWTKPHRQIEQRRQAYYPLVNRVALRHGVDTGLVMSLIEVESGFRNDAVSVKGARGLMQLMPATATRYGLRHVRELHDPQRNVEMGVHHLKDLLTLYGGHPAMAMAAYNAGSQAVARQGQRIPRYTETMLYVPAVLAGAARHSPPTDLPVAADMQ